MERKTMRLPLLNFQTKDRRGSLPQIELPTRKTAKVSGPLLTLLDEVLLQQTQTPGDDNERFANFLIAYRRHATAAQVITALSTLSLKHGSNKKMKVLDRIVDFICFWMTFQAVDLKPGSARSRLIEFIDAHMYGSAGNHLKLKLIQLDAVERTKARTSFQPSDIPTFPNARIETIAEQMTLIDSHYFNSIQPEEFLNCNWQKEKAATLAPGLTKLRKRFDKISFWTASSILYSEDPIITLVKFIRLLRALANLNNFNGAMMVLSGLNMACVQRLKSVWKKLPRKVTLLFKECDSLLSPSHNHENYRKRLAELEAIGSDRPPLIIYLALKLRDLVHIDDGNPCSSNHFSLDNVLLTGRTIRKFMALRTPSFTFEQDHILYYYLNRPPNVISNEEELYMRSLEIMPRKDSHHHNHSTTIYTPTDSATIYGIVDRPADESTERRLSTTECDSAGETDTDDSSSSSFSSLPIITGRSEGEKDITSTDGDFEQLVEQELLEEQMQELSDTASPCGSASSSRSTSPTERFLKTFENPPPLQIPGIRLAALSDTNARSESEPPRRPRRQSAPSQLHARLDMSEKRPLITRLDRSIPRTSTPLEQWTVRQVSEWLVSERLEKYQRLFSFKRVDGLHLSEIDLEGLAFLGVRSVEEQFYILSKLNEIKSNDAGAPSKEFFSPLTMNVKVQFKGTDDEPILLGNLSRLLHKASLEAIIKDGLGFQTVLSFQVHDPETNTFKSFKEESEWTTICYSALQRRQQDIVVCIAV